MSTPGSGVRGGAVMRDDLERNTLFRPAYDRRSEGYGQHCAELVFYVKGPRGVVQFLLFTGWRLGAIGEPGLGWSELYASLNQDEATAPTPADLGYHSPVPMYEGHDSMECSLMPQGRCYYDGSGLNANKPFAILVHQGSDELWKFLEQYYVETFETAKFASEVSA